MSNLDKTITFDTVRFVTYSEYISDVNDEFFDNDIDLASGEARKVEFHSRKHTDIIPFQLYIRVNYKSKRMTIEFSSKILFKDYPLLISAQTFRQCLLNIENLNICKLDIDKIIETYQYRKGDDKSYSRRVSMEEIEKNGYNLNISRYVSTAPEEEIVDIEEVRQELEKIENDIKDAKARHNEFLKELGLNLLP